MQIKTHEDTLFESIYSSVNETMVQICSQNQVDMVLDKVSKNKSFIRSICLLPYWFFGCFENEMRIDLQNELYVLGKANLMAWIGYTLYDYMRDGKIKKENSNLSLTIANVLTQKAIKDFYSLAEYDTNKMHMIDNLLSTMDLYYLDNKTIEDLHYHFKYMCDNAYRKSIGASMVGILIVWLLGGQTGGNDYIETYNFFKNYLNARQLSDDDQDMCDDMLNGIYTPATFLMRAQYSSDYIHTMMRSRIETSMRIAIDSLKNISFFDYEKFVELYVKDC